MDNSSAFFDSLTAIIAAPIYIGRSPDDLDQELRTNTWLISCSQEEAKQLAPDDFRQFFEQVIENRRHQIQAADLGHGMLFYLGSSGIPVVTTTGRVMRITDSLPDRGKCAGQDGRD